MFQTTQNQDYFDLVVERAKTVYLDWVEQFLDIMETRLDLTQHLTLNDVGCNVGQFWKGLKRRIHNVDYCGYDIEQAYLDAAVDIFPELKDKMFNLNIVDRLPRSCDICVTSSTIEHVETLNPALENLCQTTSRLLIVRTYLGEKTEHTLFRQSEELASYPVNQYAFSDVLDVLSDYGFDPKVVRDRYSDSLPKYVGKGLTRTPYVIVGEKNAK